ncbi:17-beta-hydroxysteroid dehydrogenase 14-like protein [Dinothrombium tinctorium]|uniref:17-beta-hydroxysteroid dehydrogenase 14-like protein n=2 Tax=Dinothrombium tinctorium TaxID=1965070 RepID=A0A443QL81_9ACAR|nr:17-beta-hydroxysteroid dehydrogenase 14-like protein [Dinothrombium tinctorium]RWS03811.1 17-beta-hydroxysteroid dehydrogenase 14-like protein [Dinothrombium tinctorium]
MGVTDSVIAGSILDDDFIEKFEKCIKIEVEVAIQLARLMLPNLVENKGALINDQAMLPNNMTKAALDAFTKGLVLELGPKGVRVNSVNPGIINTPAFSNFGYTSQQMEEIGQQYTVCNRAEEVANIVAFLASNASSFVTGIHLIADGGSVLK